MSLAFAGIAAAGLSAGTAYEALLDGLRRDGAVTDRELSGALEPEQAETGAGLRELHAVRGSRSLVKRTAERLPPRDGRRTVLR